MKRKQILKKLASITLAATITISSLTMGASAATVSDFTDVKPTDWYYASVEYAADNGLFSGTSTTTFSPNASMTRGMFVTVLGRLCGIDESEYLRYRFTDVKPSDYYAPYVEWAATYGIVTGATKTTFAPNKKITREQMAAILYRFAAATGNDTDFKTGALLSFSDKYKVESYALNSMGWAVDKGIINGMGGKLNASGTATRAQVAKVFYEARNVLTSTDIVIDPVEDEGKDNPGENDTPNLSNGFVYDGHDIVYRGDGSNLFEEALKFSCDDEHFYYDGKSYEYGRDKHGSTANYTTRNISPGLEYYDNKYTGSRGYVFDVITSYPNLTTLSDGSLATSKNVTALLKSLESKYPTGTPSPDCLSSAKLLSEEVFGTNDVNIVNTYAYGNNIVADTLETLRPGDIFSYRDSTTKGHTVVVIQKIYMRNDDGTVGFRGVQIAEGNYGGKWNWGRQIAESDVQSGKVEIFDVLRLLY